MKDRTILITSIYYAPESFGNAPYVQEAAEHLSELGARVVVATAYPHYPSWRFEGDTPLMRHDLLSGVEVRRRRHFLPARQTAFHRAGYELSYLFAGLTAIGLRSRPDAIIGVSPSISGAVLAAIASRLYRSPYGLVFQDIMGRAAAQSDYPGAASTSSTVRRVELAAARRAARIGVISQGFKSYFIEGGISASRLVHLPNWTRALTEPSETRAATRARLGWGEAFVCLHSGNMGFKLDLNNVLEAARLLAPHDVRVVLAGDGNDRVRLEQTALARGLSNVSFLPVQPSGRYEALLRAADVLLVNQRPSVTDMSLPSRLTSYFTAGRPVVAAVATESETQSEIERSTAGIAVPPGAPDALANAVLQLRDDIDLRTRLGARGQAYAATVLSRERQLERYAKFVAEIATSSSR